MLLPRTQVAKAQETERHIEQELKDLQATLANIEDARPFEDLTVRFSLHSLNHVIPSDLISQVQDVGTAHPRITEAVENMVKKGKWTVPGMSCSPPQDCRFSLILFAGYKEKFGDLSLL
jgi:F-type H+-transporting ATPase subunit d